MCVAQIGLWPRQTLRELNKDHGKSMREGRMAFLGLVYGALSGKLARAVTRMVA